MNGVGQVESSIFKNSETNRNVENQSNLYLVPYHPWYQGNNPDFDFHSGLILGVKRQKIEAIDYFYKSINNILSDNSYFVICVMPSHEQGIMPSGIRTIGKKLCIPSRIDGTDIITRIKTIPKKTSGGPRDFSLERSSIDIINVKYINLIKGKQVLLLDDVTTTGNSLNAAKSLLKDYGAEIVAGLALGQTTR